MGKVKRNQLCPCGSERKYKKCCLKKKALLKKSPTTPDFQNFFQHELSDLTSMPFKELNKKDAFSLIEKRDNDLFDLISSHLGAYNKEQLFQGVRQVIRGVEEYINLIFLLSSNELEKLLLVSIVDLSEVTKSSVTLTELLRKYNLNKDFIDRVVGCHIGFAATLCLPICRHILPPKKTIGELLSYFQLRRAFFPITLKHVLEDSNGSEIISEKEIPALMIQLLEWFQNFASNHEYKLFYECSNSFSLKIRGNYPDMEVFASHVHEKLESFHLIPARIPLDRFIDHKTATPFKLELKHKNEISYKEILNEIDYHVGVFEKYKITERPGVAVLREFFHSLLGYCRASYFIEIEKSEFDKLLSKIKRKYGSKTIFDLVLSGKEITAIAQPSPFIEYNNTLYSSSLLIQRYMTYFLEKNLCRIRRYQVYSGYIFEDMVKEALFGYGFNIHDITRLKNKTGTYSEFDVVTTKGNTIYNFQCKNNTLFLGPIAEDVSLFKRVNNGLVNGYKKAYDKELKRDYMLLEKLKVKSIKHFVVSRNPVITDLPYVITYQNFEQWLREKGYMN